MRVAQFRNFESVECGWAEFPFSKVRGRVEGNFEGVVGRGGNFVGVARGGWEFRRLGERMSGVSSS